MNKEIVIPYKPRPLQLALHNRTERFQVIVCHRRFGKTVKAINKLLKSSLTHHLPEPRYAYVAPFYRQAKTVAWDYLKRYAGVIPSVSFNEAELRCDLPNGARISLLGADNPDSHRGSYFDGVVFDEVAQQSPRVFPEIFRPALSDRKGWAEFIGTPCGLNNFHDLYQNALGKPDWYAGIFRASETGIIDPEELAAARLDMSEEEYAQEYECSWNAAVRGAYYGKLLEKAEADGRIDLTPYDPAKPVYTGWDIGVGDPTAIWFAQDYQGEMRVIDFYESSNEGPEFYAALLDKKGYRYCEHFLPHDGAQRQWVPGVPTRKDILQSLGVGPITVIPVHEVPVDAGINKVRHLLKSARFHREKCREGLDSLRQYREDYNERGNTSKGKPLHDWTSHAADAFRTLAVGWERRKDAHGTPPRPRTHYAPDPDWGC